MGVNLKTSESGSVRYPKRKRLKGRRTPPDMACHNFIERTKHMPIEPSPKSTPPPRLKPAPLSPLRMRHPGPPQSGILPGQPSWPGSSSLGRGGGGHGAFLTAPNISSVRHQHSPLTPALPAKVILLQARQSISPLSSLRGRPLPGLWPHCRPFPLCPPSLQFPIGVGPPYGHPSVHQLLLSPTDRPTTA